MMRPATRALQTLALRRPRTALRVSRTPAPFYAQSSFQKRLESSSAPQQQQQQQQHAQAQSSSPSTASADSSKGQVSKNNIYRNFGRPFAKVFFAAMFVYQVLYWGWEKLRLAEIKEQRLAEIKDLEQQVQDYKTKKEVPR